jgi:hypothetical protein
VRTVVALDSAIDKLVIKVGIVVMHFLRRHSGVMPGDIYIWDPLTEIRFDGVDAQGEKIVDFGYEPIACSRVREVDYSHTGLPEVPLPDVAVFAAQQKVGGGGFGK